MYVCASMNACVCECMSGSMCIVIVLVCVCVQKNVLFRGGTDVRSDERSALVYRMLTMPTLGSKSFIYPTLIALHRLSGAEGTPKCVQCTPHTHTHTHTHIYIYLYIYGHK